MIYVYIERVVPLPWYYVLMFVISVLAFVYVSLTKEYRLGLSVYGIAVVINLMWELILTLLLGRTHTFGWVQLIYQSMTELGPFVTIALVFHKRWIEGKGIRRLIM